MVAPMRGVGGRVVDQDVDARRAARSSRPHTPRPGRARRRWRRRWPSGRPGVAAAIASAASSSAVLLAGRQHHRGAAVGERRRPSPVPMPFDAPVTSADLPCELLRPRAAVSRRDDAEDVPDVAVPDRVATARTEPRPSTPAATRLHPRARRLARARGHRRAALPRRRRLDPGRLPRRRRVLRDQRLPDHVPAPSATGSSTGGIGLKRVLVPARAPGGCCPRSSSCSFVVCTLRDPVPPRHGRPSCAGEVDRRARCTSRTGGSSSATSRTSQSAGRPPLLQHVWSLAVEEQFYLLWPVILGFLLTMWGTSARSC